MSEPTEPTKSLAKQLGWKHRASKRKGGQYVTAWYSPTGQRYRELPEHIVKATAKFLPK